MREILFRGKGTCGLNAGDWIYGYYVKDFWKPTRCGCGIIPIDKERGGYCEVDPSTIGQYTGLTDKNGTKIFEGDILKTNKFSEPNKQYIVKFDLQFGAFIGEDKFNIYFVTFDGDSEQFEIIGNIYDNLELLKED